MSQEKAPASEGLDELDRASDAPLQLIFGKRWILHQARGPVAMIEPTHAAWYLKTAHEGWRAVVRRRPRRVGWCLEVTAAGGGEPVLRYYPRSLLPGGSLLLLTSAGRYKLRCPLVGPSQWTLTRHRGVELVTIKSWGRRPPPEVARPRALRPGLAVEAADEPHLPLLLAVASLAIVIHHQQPIDAGGAPMGLGA